MQQICPAWPLYSRSGNQPNNWSRSDRMGNKPLKKESSPEPPPEVVSETRCFWDLNPIYFLHLYVFNCCKCVLYHFDNIHIYIPRRDTWGAYLYSRVPSGGGLLLGPTPVAFVWPLGPSRTLVAFPAFFLWGLWSSGIAF